MGCWDEYSVVRQQWYGVCVWERMKRQDAGGFRLTLGPLVIPLLLPPLPLPPPAVMVFAAVNAKVEGVGKGGGADDDPDPPPLPLLPLTPTLPLGARKSGGCLFKRLAERFEYKTSNSSALSYASSNEIPYCRNAATHVRHSLRPANARYMPLLAIGGNKRLLRKMLCEDRVATGPLIQGLTGQVEDNCFGSRHQRAPRFARHHAWLHPLFALQASEPHA